MNNQTLIQSFSVDDIRRMREKADIRYQGMSPKEISKDIHNHARIGYKILAKLRHEKEERLRAK